jgi:Uncharacterised protein family (UPF0175)
MKTQTTIRIDQKNYLLQRIQRHHGEDLSRNALEAFAIQAYRANVITEAEVQRMLGLPSRWDTDRFLKDAKAYFDYTEVDLQSDIDAIRELRRE